MHPVQTFGLVLVAGFVAGELFRRRLALPRTSGYVVCGLLLGHGGLGWIGPAQLAAAQIFVDLALGLILFELGQLLPAVAAPVLRRRLSAGVAIALATGALLTLLLRSWGFSWRDCLAAAALALATSPAITVATCSDVGARGERTGLLYTLVAVGGCVAFAAITLLLPLLAERGASPGVAALGAGLLRLVESLLLGLAGAAVIVVGARRLDRQIEHQHLLILGVVVFAVGSALNLGLSVLLPLLACGIAVRVLDHERAVVAIRIAGDARIFLVIAFVMAGAAFELRELAAWWREALLLALARFAAAALATRLLHRPLGLDAGGAFDLAVGLQPMSSVALVLLAGTQLQASGLDPRLQGILLATILLMQLLGPLATQTAIRRFGEATLLAPPPARRSG